MSFFRIVETDELVDVESLHGEVVEIFAETAEDAVYGRDDILAVDEKGFHGGSLIVIVGRKEKRMAGMRECKECGYVGSHDYDCPNRDDPLPSYFLWYDNGTGHFDCASAHVALAQSIEAALSGWQTRQHITDVNGVVVWKNY